MTPRRMDVAGRLRRLRMILRRCRGMGETAVLVVEHLDRLGARGVFLPCPPVTRGEEVSAEAMRSPRCENHAAKDNLLHVQNAIMEAVAAAEP